MGLIFYLSSRSNPVSYDLPYGLDKVLHAIEYAVLGFMLSFSLYKSGVKSYPAIGWILAAVYGLTDEMHQAFVPMRDASFRDFAADGIGGLVRAYLYMGLRGKTTDRQENRK